MPAPHGTIDGDAQFGLANVLTPEQFVDLTQAFGGTRLYIPANVEADHPLSEVLGQEDAQRLIEALGVGSIRIPLARDFRAMHYRAQGKSIAQIARLLGMGETGVSRLLKRLRG